MATVPSPRPRNVAARPIVPTATAGAVAPSHPLPAHNAAAVAGPPMAAFDETRKNRSRQPQNPRADGVDDQRVSRIQKTKEREQRGPGVDQARAGRAAGRARAGEK